MSQLKIDQSFVRDLETSADARIIVKAVINLAHALNLNVVAEGVETAAQRDVLTAMDCDELQGYFYARPVTAESLGRWWRGIDRPRDLHFAASDAGSDVVARPASVPAL